MSKAEEAMEQARKEVFEAVLNLAEQADNIEEVRSKLKQALDEGTAISISSDKGEVDVELDPVYEGSSAEKIQAKIDEYQERLEELENNEPEDTDSDDHEDWEDECEELQDEIDEMEDWICNKE